MSRPTSSDVPAARRQPTTAGRIARAVVATAVAGAALTGCTVTVEGVPHALPQTAPAPAPTTAPPVPTRPNLPTLSDLDGEAAVYAEWVTNGWVPRPILPVTDPDSGTKAWLFGTAERIDPVGGGIAYQSLEAPASVVNWFAVFPVPAGYAPDAEQGAANTASSNNGRVVSTRPVTVAGFPGLDVRIEFTDRQGRPIVDLIRYVELPQHLVGIESLGVASDERVLHQVHQIMVDKLTIPPV
jgi:hypothetical protein